jgi:putative methyltransferase (TIGR04325 family)
MTLHDFVPPILVKISRHMKRPEALFGSFDAASAACKNGYENERLVDVIFRKTIAYRSALASAPTMDADSATTHLLLATSLSLRNGDLNVIDFGGGCGHHYFLAHALFGDRVRIKWHVVETHSMTMKARSLQDGGLAFFDNLEEAVESMEPVDLVWSSSALQYVRSPYDALTNLTRIGARHLCLTRLGLSQAGREFTIVQSSSLSANGPGPLPAGCPDGVVQYPVSIPRQDLVEKILCQSYSVRLHFAVSKAVYRAGKALIDQYGYFAVRKDVG